MSANANELIQTETIVLDMNATSRQDCLEQLAARMEAGQYVTDRALFLADVEAREQHASTAIGFGVAIPHGKSAGVVKPGLAFARLSRPLDWNALDGQPVSLIILLAIPQAEAGKEHLRVLASISRKLIHESFRNELSEAKTEEDVLRTLESALS